MGCHSLDKITLYGKGDGDVTVLRYSLVRDSAYQLEEICSPIVRGCMKWKASRTKGGPQLAASKRSGPSVIEPQGNHSATDVDELEGDHSAVGPPDELAALCMP